MAPRYKVEEDILKRRVNLPARAGHARTRYVPVAPPSYIETVLHFCHGDVMSAHLGVTKTMERVLAWLEEGRKRICPRMQLLWSRKRFPPLARMPVVDLTGPFSLVMVDAVGPLVPTERDNKYVLAFAAKRLDTVTFVETLVNGVVYRHGIPSRCLSDRGSNFISDLAKSFYETLEDWNAYLPRVLFAYRTAYHEALGDSPFFSLYGRDPVLPLDVAFLNLGEK
ncbi:hypothetical protein PHMEG_00026493 [Phytophthora megakarya]|uniref:Integrase catalytic domain-containing protein n=1 Tax=Phytophthora megakarya TaxID=4795 RepID=A0A225V9H0_9STRA|nr:hypothetical protein PHMEG_00026493 [Phytophthora megakarya]